MKSEKIFVWVLIVQAVIIILIQLSLAVDIGVYPLIFTVSMLAVCFFSIRQSVKKNSNIYMRALISIMFLSIFFPVLFLIDRFIVRGGNILDFFSLSMVAIAALGIFAFLHYFFIGKPSEA